MCTIGWTRAWASAALAWPWGSAHPVQVGHEKLDLHAQFEITRRLVDSDWRNYTFVFQADEAYTHFTFGLWGRRPGFEKTTSKDEPGLLFRGRLFHRAHGDANFLQPQAHSGSSTPAQKPLFVPNAFTPDLNDVNDRWMPSLPEMAVHGSR